MTAITTSRLVLRPVTRKDHAALQALFTQPGVRRYLFDDEVLTDDRTAEIIRTSQDLFEEHGYGLWLARTQREELPVGFGAFWYFRDPPELELLYGVGDRYLKQGFGREIARAVVDFGFDVLQMTAIRASTNAPHIDSQRLLHDLQFTFERRAVVGGLDTTFYVRQR